MDLKKIGPDITIIINGLEQAKKEDPSRSEEIDSTITELERFAPSFDDVDTSWVANWEVAKTVAWEVAKWMFRDQEISQEISERIFGLAESIKQLKWDEVQQLRWALPLDLFDELFW